MYIFFRYIDKFGNRFFTPEHLAYEGPAVNIMHMVGVQHYLLARYLTPNSFMLGDISHQSVYIQSSTK